MLEATIRVAGMEYREYVKKSIIGEFLSHYWNMLNKSYALIMILNSFQCQDLIYAYMSICN